MWARYLRAENDLLTELYPFVEFANELERFEVEFGLDDDSWRSRDPLGEQKSRGAQDSLLGVP